MALQVRLVRLGVVVVVVIIVVLLSFTIAKIRLFFDICKCFCVFMSILLGCSSILLGCSSIDFGGFCGVFVLSFCVFFFVAPPSWGSAPRCL